MTYDSGLQGQKTKGLLLFYFLKLYNFGLNEIFVGSTSSELQHQWISKIRCEPKKSRKKSFFRLNFEVLLIYRSLWNFTCSLQVAWILNCEFIKILCVHCMGMKNELTFMQWRPKWAFFSFFLLAGKLIKVIFFLVPTRKFLWCLTTTYEIFIKIYKTFTR